MVQRRIGFRPTDSIQPPILSDDAQHYGIPGVAVSLSPDDADSLGAFREDALTEADALDSAFDDGALD